MAHRIAPSPPKQETIACTICLDPVDIHGPNSLTTVCNHHFHTSCYVSYITQSHKKECPNCRHPVDKPLDKTKPHPPQTTFLELTESFRAEIAVQIQDEQEAKYAGFISQINRNLDQRRSIHQDITARVTKLIDQIRTEKKSDQIDKQHTSTLPPFKEIKVLAELIGIKSQLDMIN